MINVLYFARLREQLETGSEEMEISADLNSLADILNRLKNRGGAWEEVFAGDQPVLMAVNQEMSNSSVTVKDGDEVAFFPPVTGG